MKASPDLTSQGLETRTREAHRAYIEALRHWEDICQRLDNPRNKCADNSVDERQSLCDNAELRKERRRVAFRNLCDELGYLPSGLNADPSADGAASGSPACA